MRKIKIIGVPLDLGAGRRGVDMGPSAVRLAGLAEHLRQLGHQVIDIGNLDVPEPETHQIADPRLKYLSEITAACAQLAETVGKTLEEKQFPLVLGGDHSIAMGTIAGVSEFHRRQQKEIGVIWIDAHGDMNSPETTPSGNIHGMPLAVCLGKGVPQLLTLGSDFRKLNPARVVLIGVRSLDQRERDFIRDSGITVFLMADIDRLGIYNVMAEALRITTLETHMLHVSLDMDSLDPSEAPGVGTPALGGLTYREAHTIMEMIADADCLGSLEIVEINPILDIKNTTAELAVELAASGLGKRII
jgi:arginase